MEFDVLRFGAAGDGTSNDTAAIQAAIDACAAQGGGRVVLPGGRTYRTGMLVLGSNLELHLEMGAVLKGSDILADYTPSGNPDIPRKRPVPSYENSEYTGLPGHFFLYARDCENLAITGLGVIDGNQAIWQGDENPWHIEGSFYPRAPLLFLENVANLTIRDVTLRRSAFWTVHLVGCRDVVIDGIRIHNDLRMANCDGIDPDHCQNVRISNCHIECADDCLVFKNTAAAMRYGPCENITVTNCILTSASAAIKFGSESEALFRNILVENCVISRSNRGISLQLRDQGSIENVSFRNIAIQTQLFKKEFFWGAAEPIAITVLKRKPGAPVGTVRSIRFSDIFCQSENGVFLYAEDENAIEDICFRNVTLELQRTTDYKTGFHDLRPSTGPAFTDRRLVYVYGHNAARVQFRDCDFRAMPEMECEMDQPFFFENCPDLRV
ncbi:MAG: glycoside hydrolase family 28 protein [Oscillospiraceae bacterium]|nr:glycoside hydrolase family 28 protein [Oscillospiraceae bacterium]